MSELKLDPSIYFPCYQPIVDLVSGTIGGYEALARYRDSNGVVCSAGALFYTPGLPQDAVLAVDRHVRATALRHFATIPDAGYIAINISPNRMGSLVRGASATVAMIEDIGIDPRRVLIEITEGRGDLEQIQLLVAEYRRAGLRIAIDDFGAGASQIDRIVALKPDILKLDMRLFKQAAQGGLSADVTLAAAAIAERVGCEIVCEGVETVEELHFGIECGARYIQGFVFAQAELQLLPANQPLEQVRAVQKYFLERKIEKLRLTATHNHEVCDCVRNIKSFLLQDKAECISAQELFKRGVLRYYICSADGTQISDVMEVERETFSVQPQYRGSNWSHRPYFPLLLALRSSFARELVVSNCYRDAMSRQLCKTYGTYLSDDRILLVDVAVEDDVLYAPMD